MNGLPALPSLFLAHGSPMLALEGGAWGRAIGELGRKLPSLSAVLVCSAHWETSGPFRVSAGKRPGVMHDFGGFPAALYALEYPAPGSQDLASEVASLMTQAGLETLSEPDRPLDHGAWVPLRYLLPEADVPVVQLSLPRVRTPELLLASGRALAPLRKRGVLILGSGGIVHNLRRLDWSGGSGPQSWATSFQGWIRSQLDAGQPQELLNWKQAPGSEESVPTSEHLDPLFVAMGASDGRAEVIYEGWQLGSLSLASYLFP